MERILIRINKDGQVSAIVPTLYLKKFKEAFSGISFQPAKVVPKNPILRGLFYLLDFIAPVGGWLYKYIRGWNCNWIIKSKYLLDINDMVFSDRSDAVYVETVVARRLLK